MRYRKKTHVLLELLIVLALIAYCALPLVSTSSQLLGGQIQALQRVEAVRIGDLAFASLFVQLHQNQIPWAVVEKGDLEFFQNENPSECAFGSLSFVRRGTLRTLYKKTGKNGEDYRLVKVEISLQTKPKKFLWLKQEKDKNGKLHEVPCSEVCFSHELFLTKLPVPTHEKKVSDAS